MKTYRYLATLVALVMVFSLIISVPVQAQDPGSEKEAALAWLDEHEEQMVANAKWMWENPELGLEEVEASKLHREFLEEYGFEVEAGVADMPTAFVATYGSGAPTVCTLGEYDALPGISQECMVAEKIPVEEGAPGQGCGHNLYGTASFGAAAAIAHAMDEYGLEGTVKAFGTPAEETLIGKIYMAKEGLFDTCDIMLSWHPGSSNSAGYGSCLAMNSAKFTFSGRAAHAAAAPFHGRSALDAVELMNLGTEYMREHAVTDKARIHYVITDGGMAPNVVPPTAQVWYFFRSPKRADVDQIWDWVQDIAQGAALMTQTEVDTELITASWEVLPNWTLAQLYEAEEEKAFARELQASMGKEDEEPLDETITELAAEKPETPSVGPYSTDQGDVSWIIPTGTMGAATYVKGTPGHSWQAVATTGSSIGFKGMMVAAKTIALSGIEALMDPTWIEKAQAEFEEAKGDIEYYTALPEDQKAPKSIR
jgi:aminobenzoyl-glutamate utilization protein B